jgi:hypothetical protein
MKVKQAYDMSPATTEGCLGERNTSC